MAHREIFCVHSSKCLYEAALRNLDDFSCEGCGKYVRERFTVSEAGDEFEGCIELLAAVRESEYRSQIARRREERLRDLRESERAKQSAGLLSEEAASHPP
jgi:hypothetical protein